MALMDFVTIVGFLVGLAGLLFGLYRDRQLRTERMWAAQELNTTYSHAGHIEWWIRHNPSTRDRDALANEVVALLHSMRINLNNNARRYGIALESIGPFSKTPSAGVTTAGSTQAETGEEIP